MRGLGSLGLLLALCLCQPRLQLALVPLQVRVLVTHAYEVGRQLSGGQIKNESLMERA